MKRKICSNCQLEKPITAFYPHKRDGYRSECKSCKIPYRKSGYAGKYAYKTPENAIKHRARVMINYRVKRGIIKRQPCIKCNSLKSQAHHTDYSKPLEIIWLCIKHHREEHIKGGV